METALLFLAFLILLLFGLPIALSVGASSVIYLLLNDIPLSVVPRKMFTGIDSFVLLCVPGFILAGSLMNSGGITRRLIRFSNALIGHIKGGWRRPMCWHRCFSPVLPVRPSRIP